MKTNELITKLVGWAEAIRPEGTGDSTTSLVGSTIEIRNKEIAIVKREKTAILFGDVDVDDQIKFTSDQYPGSGTEVTEDDKNVIFSWKEKGKKREVSYPKPDADYFDKVAERVNMNYEGQTFHIKTNCFDDLTREIRFTTLEATSKGLALIQEDPRGIKSKILISEEKERQNVLRDLF